MKQITCENCCIFLDIFLRENKLKKSQVASAITCSVATINRILTEETLPTERMLKQVAIMIELGFPTYVKLSKSQKEKISEMIGTVGGGVLGFSSISTAISTLGVTGLSASGVTSGLATLGSIMGGGMVAGLLGCWCYCCRYYPSCYWNSRLWGYAWRKISLG